MINVHWEDAWQYADWLTEQTGEEYRLLSEAEWEYVARAGTRTERYWGDAEREQCRYANGYDANGHLEHGFDWESVGCRDRQASTAPAGTYLPNGFGLYDVLGNVWEWVDDCCGDYEDAPADGRSSYEGDCSPRVLRGGSWGNKPRALRSALRDRDPAGYRSYINGFRVARTMN